MNALDKLAKQFERFPGIGPRQARRFVHHLLTEDTREVEDLARIIADIQKETIACRSCFRFFSQNGGRSAECSICVDTKRNNELLMVVERDSDVTPVERSGIYDGYYFVLGGTVPLLDSVDTKRIRSAALRDIVEKRLKDGLTEVILAFSVNPDGENTTRYVESVLKELREQFNFKISILGRGLSTGSELEYADPETIKSALENRH